MTNDLLPAGVNRPRVTFDRPVRRIVVLRALFLGDLLCATPALRALHRRFPDAEITLIGLPWAADLVARLPYLHRIEPFPGFPGIVEVPYDVERTASWLAAARTREFDLAIQMHGSGVASNGFISALGARDTLGYRVGHDDRLTAPLSWVEDEHEIHRWLRLVAALDTPAESATLDFPLTAADQANATTLLAEAGQEPLVGLHPGAKDPARRWPPERFAALGTALAREFGARIVLTGGPGERAITAAVRRAIMVPVIDLTGQTDLGTFAAVISRLDLLVTNDTGASHLAAATGTPSVVLFGPTRPCQWAPLDRERHRVVDAPLETGIADRDRALAELPVPPVLVACAPILSPMSPPLRIQEQKALCVG